VLTATALRDLAAFGPFFAVDTHLAGSVAHQPWHPMSELVEDPRILRDRVAAVRAQLASTSGRSPQAVELRVAASVTHLGLVARLVSPALAAAVTTGQLLKLDLASTRWQRTLGGAFPLSVPVPADTSTGNHDMERLACLLAHHILDGPVRDLVQATMPLSVSPRILWGNAASAINGALSMMATRQPPWAQRSRVLASLLLDQPPLHNTSITTSTGIFRRRSCCLIYRAAPTATGAVCGDCVLLP
jgi:ferric iron reductase protein FhuF